MKGIIIKFSKILNSQQKVRVIIIGIMMVIGAFLETLGVGLILPLTSVITTPNIIRTNKYARMVCDYLDIQTSKSFIIFIIIALIFIYIFKNLYLFLEYYVQYRFICNNRFSIQSKLMEVYLQRPYDFFLNAESGEIIRVVISDTGGAFALLSTLLGFFTEAVVSTALIIAIVVTDPIMALLLATVLGGIMFLINRLIKPILRKAGVKYQKDVAQMNKWLLQAINGIKEIKIAEKEDYFLIQFSKYGKSAIDSEKKNNVLGTVPRLAIEAFGICSMLTVIAVLMWSGRDISMMLPQLSAFAMAAVRLMPSVNRMSASLNSMAYMEPSLDKLMEHLSETKRWNNNKLTVVDGDELTNQSNTLKGEIKLSDIVFSYPNAKNLVLNHANMSVPIGKSVGIIGASGAGKTTVVDIMLGLLKPLEGQVLVNGIDIQTAYHAWLAHIGYIPQTIFMLDGTIRGNVAFGMEARDIDDSIVWNALEESQLAEFVRSLPKGLDTEIGERGIRLSGGQRQRIGIARALYRNPELLIFDEATSALDNETENAIMESINALHGKKTMVIIAHRLTTIESCDMVYRVENGKIEKTR